MRDEFGIKMPTEFQSVKGILRKFLMVKILP